MLLYIAENIREIKKYILRDENSEVLYPNEIPDLLSRYEFLKALLKDSNPSDITQYNQLLSDILGILASSYYKSSDFDKCRDFAMEKMELDEFLNNTKGLARCYSIIGNLYLNFGDIPRAISMHLKRLDICRKLEDKKGIAISLTNLGNCEMINENYPAALKYNIEAVDVYRSINTKDSKFASMLGNLGQSYYYLKDYDNALSYLHQSIDIKKDHDDFSKSNSLAMIGCAYVDNKKYDKGFEYFAKSLESSRKLGDKTSELTTLLALANTNLKLGNVDKAIDTLNKALKDNEDHSEDMNYSALYASLYECYKIKKDFKNAFLNFNKYIKITEKIELQSSERIISNLKNLHELENIRIYNKAKSLRNDQLKMTLEKLEKVNNELSLANTEKNEMLSVIAHDLRNPVSNIKLISQLSSDGDCNIEVSELQGIDLITASCEDILNILNDLVDPGSKDSGANVKYTSFDIVKLLKRAIVLFNLNASSKKLNIKLITLDDELFLKSDYRSVYQIIDNLLSNSIKFSPNNSVIEIKVQRSRNNIILSFKDNAGGFTEEEMSKYFSGETIPFSSNSESEGFGLSIVTKLISNIRGKITCRNLSDNEVKGSEINIVIPDNTISIL